MSDGVLEGIDFVPREGPGRRFSARTVIRLGDVGADGVLRPDGLARLLQDVATDDWRDIGLDTGETWVVRRTAVRAEGEWPRYLDDVELTTWCGGYGAAWAERRTDLNVAGELRLSISAIWVPIDLNGSPLRLRPEFMDVYGEAIQGRRVSGRIRAAEAPVGAERRHFALRRSDLDVVGHVNNAVAWQAFGETMSAPRAAVVLHHGPLLSGDRVEIVSDGGRQWLCVDDEVRVSVQYEG